jgi:Bacterial PH domain
MGDPVTPERPGGRHGAVQEQAGMPAMPVISPSEQIPGVPYRLLNGLKQTIGWRFRPPAEGGPAFVILRRAGLGPLRVVESFPLTEDGWASAWQSLVRQNPAAARKVLTALRTREAEARLRAPSVEDYLRFDNQGVTVRNWFRTYRIGWAEVRRFVDGSVYGPGNQDGLWALAIVLHNGQTVIARGTAASDASSKTLVAAGQAAERYDIPADLTGTIERGSFPDTLLGTSGTIRVTIRDESLADDGREPVLEVIQRTEPVQPGDILALSDDGTEVKVLGVRQIFAGGRWEQVAYVWQMLTVQLAVLTYTF